MSYKPKPIDTSHIRMSEELHKDCEKLAENIHEQWALQRFREGWTYGPSRNDAVKQHPGLIPYEELGESEKEYDRITVIQTIKSLLALGYRIEK